MRRVLPLLGGVLALVAVNLPWAKVSGGGYDLDLSGVDVTGGLGQALALTLLAGWLALLALRRWGRVAMAVLVGLLGLSMIALAVLGHDVDAETARAELRTVSLAEPLVTVQWWAPALFGVAGALAVAGAALLARTGPAPRSFERSAGTDPTAWEQLDAGDDPTTAGADDGGASDAEETQWAQAEGEDGR